MLVQITATLPTQLPTNVPGRAVNGALNAWTPAMYRGDQVESLAVILHLAQSWSLRACGVNPWMEDVFLSLKQNKHILKKKITNFGDAYIPHIK